MLINTDSRIANDRRKATKVKIPVAAFWCEIRMPDRELPMPTVTRITSLTQAHATLLHCWTRLSKFIGGSAPNSDSPDTPISEDSDEGRNRFQSWLEQWENAFTAYLSTAMPSMVNEDITESRILKTNHLACTIVASGINATTSQRFDGDFNAILELSTAVLRSRFLPETPQDALAERRTLRTGANLDVFHPLQLVCTYSSQEDTRRRAAELLMDFRLRS